jgi:hypothetical protein
MEVKIPKEIREYQESIYFGLSTRQFTCSVIAVIFAVGVYFLLKDAVGTETVSWLCILCAAPFAAIGFFRYHGLTAEQFVLVWLKSEFIMPKRLVYHAEIMYEAVIIKIIEGERKR